MARVGPRGWLRSLAQVEPSGHTPDPTEDYQGALAPLLGPSGHATAYPGFGSASAHWRHRPSLTQSTQLNLCGVVLGGTPEIL